MQFYFQFNIEFSDSEYFGPNLNYDVNRGEMAKQWNNKFPVEKWPVLAFTGAPAAFPLTEVSDL